MDLKPEDLASESVVSPPSARTKKRRVSAEQAAIYLRTHADVLMRMPASEQMIGARDSVLFAALNQIADALDELRQRAEKR